MTNQPKMYSVDECNALAVRATLEGFAGTGDPLTNDAREALRDSLLETARWRREKAEQFPNDT